MINHNKWPTVMIVSTDFYHENGVCKKALTGCVSCDPTLLSRHKTIDTSMNLQKIKTFFVNLH